MKIIVSENGEHVKILRDRGDQPPYVLWPLTYEEAAELYAGLRLIHRIAGDEPRDLIASVRTSTLDDVVEAVKRLR